ncbi:hypothetical protein TNCV_1796771 [Trichonephila clavipes]|nr:hypothetical protein TNCV_1796771 [Trichonephila clavipes]
MLAIIVLVLLQEARIYRSVQADGPRQQMEDESHSDLFNPEGGRGYVGVRLMNPWIMHAKLNCTRRSGWWPSKTMSGVFFVALFKKGIPLCEYEPLSQCNPHA